MKHFENQFGNFAPKAGLTGLRFVVHCQHPLDGNGRLHSSADTMKKWVAVRSNLASNDLAICGYRKIITKKSGYAVAKRAVGIYYVLFVEPNTAKTLRALMVAEFGGDVIEGTFEETDKLACLDPVLIGYTYFCSKVTEAGEVLV